MFKQLKSHQPALLSGMLMSLLLTACGAFNQAAAQCTPTTFALNQAPVVTGPAGAVGTTYRRSNVLPGVDVVMTITALTNGATVWLCTGTVTRCKRAHGGGETVSCYSGHEYSSTGIIADHQRHLLPASQHQRAGDYPTGAD